MKKSNNSLKKLEECKKTCPGPDKCPFKGVLIDEENQVAISCSIYAGWVKQKEIEKEIMRTIPKSFWKKTFENFESRSSASKRAFELAKKYTSLEKWRDGANLALLGGYGTGKTHLAGAIASQAIKQGNIVAFVTLTSVAVMDFSEKRTYFEKMRDVDLLILDDISQEVENKFILQEMFNLINYRYEAQKGIVFTSNLKTADFKGVIGERLFDRVMERTVFVEIFDVKSIRLKKREQFTNWAKEV